MMKKQRKHNTIDRELLETIEQQILTREQREPTLFIRLSCIPDDKIIWECYDLLNNSKRVKINSGYTQYTFKNFPRLYPPHDICEQWNETFPTHDVMVHAIMLACVREYYELARATRVKPCMVGIPRSFNKRTKKEIIDLYTKILRQLDILQADPMDGDEQRVSDLLKARGIL